MLDDEIRKEFDEIRKDIDEICKMHEEIGYERGLRDGYAQAVTELDESHHKDVDTISMQAAIEAADKIIERDTSGNNDVVKAMTAWKEYLKGMPPASADLQPTCNQLATDCNQLETDLISRKAAIDAFGLSEKTRKYGGDRSGYDTLMKYEIQIVLESLPPAQPEIIRCKECKNASDDEYLHCTRVTWYNGDEDFCSKAKRREYDQ